MYDTCRFGSNRAVLIVFFNNVNFFYIVSIRPDMDEESEPVNSLTEEHTAPLIQCE